jgi:hypothetical protein
MALEFYGKIDDQLEGKALAAHKAFIQGKKFESGLYEQRGSLPMLRLKQTNDTLYTVPVKEDEGEEEQKQQPAAKEGEPAAEEESKSTESTQELKATKSKDDPPAAPSDEQPAAEAMAISQRQLMDAIVNSRP